MRLRRVFPWLVVLALAVSGLCLSLAAVFSWGLAGYNDTNIALDKTGDNALNVPVFKLVESGVIDLDKALAAAGHSASVTENEGLRLRALNSYLFGGALRKEAGDLRSKAAWYAAFAAVNLLGCGTLAVSLRNRAPQP